MTSTEPEPRETVRVTTPASLLAIVPRLLTFQPANSLVLIGTAPLRARVRLTLRYDLPDPPDPDIAADIARHSTSVLRAQGIETAAVVGYGPGPLVTPVTDALRERAAATGLRITDLLRAENQRYWSYLCPNPDCCPREGTEFEMPKSLETLDGGPVLASRDELRGSLASATGKPGESMTAATRRAIRTRLRTEADAGLGAVRDAIVRYENGDCDLSFDEVARITVALRESDVRDDAWYRMTPEYREQHLRLWADITRLARPGHVAAPASLLAFTAWQCADGALANIALDRALADCTDFPMATALRRILDSGLPWSRVRHLVPPELAA